MATNNESFYAPSGIEFGDGSIQTASYSNANVASYLPTYSGNLGAITGNVTTTGNVTGNFIIGDGSLLSNINVGNVVGAYSNANVANYLPTYSGNLSATNFTTSGVVTLGNVSNVKITGGSNTQVLMTDGTGNLSWVTLSASAGGSNTQIQFNNAGVLSGSSNLTWNGTTLSVTGNISGNGSLLSNINGPNIVGVVGNANSFAGGQGAGAGSFSVSIGYTAGQNNQSSSTVAIGGSAGKNVQGANSIAIGSGAGITTQGTESVAIGRDSGGFNQGINSVGVGTLAGWFSQAAGAVAVGQGAGSQNQSINTVAVGYTAGYTSQGANSVAIGFAAGQTSQPANSIIINATGAAYNASADGFYVKPVRNISTSSVLYYSTSSGEVTYGPPSITPGGSNTQIQFNNAGSLGASANLTWNGSNLSVTGNTAVTGNISVGGNTIISGNETVTGNVTGNYFIGNVGNVTSSTSNLRITGGVNGQILSTDGTGNISWITPSGVAPQPGLYSGLITTPPILSTWTQMNIASPASVADSAVGPVIKDAFGTGPRVRGLYKAAPSTPYTATALFATDMPWSNYSGAGIMFTDGTKIQSMIVGFNVTPSMRVVNFNTTGSFNADATPSQSWFINPASVWMQISDDGTNVSFYHSMDGVNWNLRYQVAKSSGFLGASGYTNIGFQLDVEGTAPAGTTLNSSITLLSWKIT